MKRPDAMHDVLKAARLDIELIEELAREGDEFLESKATTPNAALTAQERAQLRSVGEMFLKATKPGVKTTVHVSENVTQLVWRIAGSVKQRTFFAEMALVYLVSRLEAFLKDYLQAVFLQDPRRLRSSAQLTYEQALRYPSMPALRRALAEREAEALGYKSIDDVERALKERFGVRLSDFPKWQLVREVVYRRNLVVHNRGVVNDIYRSKIGFGGKKKHLGTDMKYVQATSSTILEFIDFLHSSLGKESKRAI
jgi:hypothetical protein